MRLGKDLENKPIVSVADGRILGRAKDVYVDRDLRRMAGLYVGSEGVIRRKSLVIPSEQVVLLGIDVILVKDADVVTTEKALDKTGEWYRLDQLEGREVRTPGGTKLGMIGDIILDEYGAVSAVALSKVYVSGPLAQKAMIPRDVIVDVFQSSDAIQVDLPRLESVLAGISKEAEAEAAAAPIDDIIIAPADPEEDLVPEPGEEKEDDPAD